MDITNIDFRCEISFLMKGLVNLLSFQPLFALVFPQYTYLWGISKGRDFLIILVVEEGEGLKQIISLPRRGGF